MNTESTPVEGVEKASKLRNIRSTDLLLYFERLKTIFLSILLIYVITICTNMIHVQVSTIIGIV